MVDHIFSDAAMEPAWHEHYAGYLLKLLGVPGLTTAQRFKAVDASPPRFLAMYSVSSPAIYDSPEYKAMGGGGSQSARFHGAYQMWTRNLCEGAEFAPEVKPDELVFTLDCDAPDEELSGLFPGKLVWLHSVGLHITTQYRALVILDRESAAKARSVGRGFIYAPFTAFLTSQKR
jgi:hypothetical protein